MNSELDDKIFYDSKNHTDLVMKKIEKITQKNDELNEEFEIIKKYGNLIKFEIDTDIELF